MKARSKPSGPVRGYVLSEVFCAHSDRRKPHKMPSMIQSHRAGSRISGCLLLHLLCMCSAILTVTVCLWFGTDSYRLTSERMSLVRWVFRTLVSNSGSSCLNFKETDEAALRHLLIVVDFLVELRMVPPCARCGTQSTIAFFVALAVAW